MSNVPNVLLSRSQTQYSQCPQRPEDPPLKPTARPSLVRRAAAKPLRTGLIAAAIVAGILALVLGLVFGLRARGSSSSTAPIANAANLDVSPPTNAFPSVQEAYVSFAIEFYYFPDFAGKELCQLSFGQVE